MFPNVVTLSALSEHFILNIQDQDFRIFFTNIFYVYCKLLTIF